MKKSFWKQLFWGSQGKPYSAWQIELTTRCPLRCKMCCREGHYDMARQDMPLQNFRKLAPYFKNVEAVVLEGWGESLLHPHLIDCIRIVKQEGTKVGFVTSGKTLNEAYVSELVEACARSTRSNSRAVRELTVNPSSIPAAPDRLRARSWLSRGPRSSRTSGTPRRRRKRPSSTRRSSLIRGSTGSRRS